MTRTARVALAFLLVVVWMGLPPVAVAQEDVPPTPASAPQTIAPLPDSPRAAMLMLIEGFRDLRSADDTAAWERILGSLHSPPELADDAEGLRQAARALMESLEKLRSPDEVPLPGSIDVRLSGAARYVYFPGSPAQSWVYDRLMPFGRWPEGRIELARHPDGGWRFTPETVRNAPALAESLAPLPPRTFAAYTGEEASDASKVVSLLGPTFAFTPWWAWLALLGLIFAGLTAGRLIKTGSERLGRHWAAAHPLRAVAAEGVGNPASLALLTLGLHAGLVLFVHLDDIEPFIYPLIKFLYLIAIGWGLWNLIAVIEIALVRVTARTATKLDDMVVPLARRSLRIFLVVLFTLFVAQNVFGLDITGWLAGLGLAGLAISLAAQDSVKNLFGWVTVLFDRPFSVGDLVNFGGTTGTVEEIGFRSTRVRLMSGAVHTIPNMKWIDTTVENISARKAIRRDLNLSLTYDTPPEKIEEAVRIVEDILHNDPRVVEDLRYDPEKQRPQVHFDDFKADYLNIKVYYWYVLGGDPLRNYPAFLRHCQGVNLMILRRFAASGIEIAFPTRTLLLRNDPHGPLEVRTAATVSPS